MKQLLALVLGLAVLATLSGLATAKASEPVVDKGGWVLHGFVSQVDPKTRTFTLKAKGKEYKFLFPKAGMQPKVGEIVDVTYAGALGGAKPAQAINVNPGGIDVRSDGIK